MIGCLEHIHVFETWQSFVCGDLLYMTGCAGVNTRGWGLFSGISDDSEQTKHVALVWLLLHTPWTTRGFCNLTLFVYSSLFTSSLIPGGQGQSHMCAPSTTMLWMWQTTPRIFHRQKGGREGEGPCWKRQLGPTSFSPSSSTNDSAVTCF